MIFLRSICFLFLFTCYLFSCPGLSLSQDGYQFVTAWGSHGSGDGQFYHPYAVAVDSSGNVYVADQANNRIQKFSSTGSYITQWGSLGSGNGQFNNPYSVAVDSSGNVYVSDYLNNRIQKFSPAGSYITQWGSHGAGNGQFNRPWGVAVDSSGNVYVADNFNNRIQKFSPTGSYITQWGSHGSGNGQFRSPEGVAVDSSGNVYVADQANKRIQKFSLAGSYITQWSSTVDGPGFYDPEGVAVDSSGNIYVADSLNDRIQKFTSTGSYITQWGSHGSGDGEFSAPEGVAVDSSGNVYVAELGGNRIQKFAPSCGCSLSPPAYAHSSQSATGMVTVITSPTGCTWPATSNDSWIHITSGSTGQGNGTVSYDVDVNTTGVARKGTIVIGVEAFTIRQAVGAFYDDPNDFFTPHIYAINTEGITRGCWGDPNYYCPSDVVTRGAMAAFIIRAMYGEDFSYTQAPYFFDVPASNGYFKYVQKMRDDGITLGCWGDTNYYCPDDVVTRGAMAAFIIRAKYGENFIYTQTPYFTDVPDSNGYFKYVQKMKDDGITGNVGTYNWTDVVIREHMAAFLARAFLWMQ